MFGYHSCYLRIDVANGYAKRRPLDAGVLRQFIGGVGLGTWLLQTENRAGVDALDPSAAIVFAFSPLVGTPLTTSAKFAVVAKSPLTNRLNDALSSSHFALSGKKTGADALVIVGRAEQPVVIVIDDGVVRLEPAGDVWGLPTHEAAARLKKRFGPDYHAAVIGPAGERLVKFATISHDNRHAGRGGLGAVLGSKNVKAVLVRGTQHTTVADPNRVVAAARELSRQSFGPATAKYRELGTVSNLLTFNRLNALPTRNFQTGSFEGAEAISGEALNAGRRLARSSCAACTIGCEHIYQTPNGQGVRLEYESLFALGSLCGISDPDAVLQAAQLCDELGMDTISAGATVAFAMECSERGLLSKTKLRFGNAAAMIDTLRRIAAREGMGDLLAEGTRRAAATIGGDAPNFAPHVKGLEIPGYEPRALQTMALGFAVGSRGADHNRSGAYEADFSTKVDRLHGSDESAKWAVDTEDRAALIDSLILCKFLRGVFDDLYAESAALLEAVTGWNVTGAELRHTAVRIVTAKKLFNMREGWTPAEDTLPQRMLGESLTSSAGMPIGLPSERLHGMIAAYYEKRGWTADGYVPATQTDRLGLTTFARGS
ncbi:MAG TPA: aldehyde ferredoxin oxidoreductase family protein [Gemmataceae bacterium]|jgi:aldehyde:ferredoxin oxidoreductase|nr:aldehyde ferredoxin oxidoreductase family protein [Gemmataceae bacterium]